MIVYEENTKRIVIPSGLGNLTGLMEAEAQAMYNSGRTDGYNEGVEDGKSIQDRKLTDSVTFNENGEYDANYGYKKVIVDVDNQCPKYDYTMQITYPMAGFHSMWGMSTSFYVNGVEYPYTFEMRYEPFSVNVFIETEMNDDISIISIDMKPYFINPPVEGGDRYPTPDEMTITFGGVPMTVTAWTMGEYEEEPFSGRYYQPYHIECEPLSLDRYEIGFSDGYASGYTDGQASCPECSGSTDCSSAITEAFESGYTNGYTSGYTDGEASCPECSGSTDCSSAITEAYQRGVGEGFIQATANGARVMNMEGTITFDQDTPMDRNFAIHIFMESEDTGYAIIDDYIMIDSTSLHDLKEQGATVSAGTYDFFVAVNEEVRYHDDLDVFRIRGPICSISGVTFDAYLYFSKLA